MATLKTDAGGVAWVGVSSVILNTMLAVFKEEATAEEKSDRFLLNQRNKNY